MHTLFAKHVYLPPQRQLSPLLGFHCVGFRLEAVNKCGQVSAHCILPKVSGEEWTLLTTCTSQWAPWPLVLDTQLSVTPFTLGRKHDLSFTSGPHWSGVGLT